MTNVVFSITYSIIIMTFSVIKFLYILIFLLVNIFAIYFSPANFYHNFIFAFYFVVATVALLSIIKNFDRKVLTVYIVGTLLLFLAQGFPLFFMTNSFIGFLIYLNSYVFSSIAFYGFLIESSQKQ